MLKWTALKILQKVTCVTYFHVEGKSQNSRVKIHRDKNYLRQLSTTRCKYDFKNNLAPFFRRRLGWFQYQEYSEPDPLELPQNWEHVLYVSRMLN